MTTSDETVEGACFCGAVTFNVKLPVQFCGHCHCSMCRRAHGAGYVTWIAVPRSNVSFPAGEGKLVRFKSSEHGTRSFCGTCGSTLFCETAHDPERIDIVLANMNGSVGVEPQAHIYFDSRADWVVIGDKLPRLGGPTGMAPLDDAD